MAETTSRLLSHKHYLYKALFNNVFIQENKCYCSLEDQSLNFQKQNMQDNFPDETPYLLYCDETLCIHCLTTTVSRSPSEATAKREFNVIESTIDNLLEGTTTGNKEYTREYILPEKIDEIFTADLVSYASYDSFLQEIQTKIDDALLKLAQGNDKQEVVTSIVSLKSTIDAAKSCGMENKRRINDELPYSEWLYTLTRENLVPRGFVVEREQGESPIAHVNEYLGGRKDLLIYHPARCEAVVNALYVGICSPKAVTNECNIFQGIAELKVHSVNAAAENEYYYRMFAEAVELTLKILASGKLVKKSCHIWTCSCDSSTRTCVPTETDYQF